jgi:hypothetical protein
MRILTVGLVPNWRKLRDLPIPYSPTSRNLVFLILNTAILRELPRYSSISIFCSLCSLGNRPLLLDPEYVKKLEIFELMIENHYVRERLPDLYRNQLPIIVFVYRPQNISIRERHRSRFLIDAISNISNSPTVFKRVSTGVLDTVPSNLV